MDLSILVFLTAVSAALFVLAIVTGTWIRLALGWIAGGLLIIIGYTVGDGEEITTNVLLSTDAVSSVALDLGISNENFMIIYILTGSVMVVVATFMDK